MPPKPNKKEPKGPSSKTLQKEKAKVVEDKTFGLKNKNKSKAVQNYVKQVTTQVMDGGQKKGGQRAQEEAKFKDKAEKSKSAAQKALIASLFKGVTQIQTTEDGQVDKKATLCPYFKAGVCEKGKKCKFSHDLSLEDNRSLAIDLYSDPRAKSGRAPDTIITCRDFLEAVEKNLYGFNWTCPNGGDGCQYRHMLPMGYVLNRDKGDQSSDSDEEEMTLEEKIEEERANLIMDECTPVTYESFMKWKADRAARKQAEIEQKIIEEEAKGRTNRGQMAFMSGKALFTFNPELFAADDDDADVADIEEQNSDEEETKEGGAAQQRGSDDDEEEKKQPEDDEEEKKEDPDGGPAVQVDSNLFAGEELDAAEEEVDFD